MSFETVLQRAMYAQLSGDSFLASVAPIFDRVKQKTPFPYVTIGEDSLINWDTDTELGMECTCVINTWSRPGNATTNNPAGLEETKRIQGLIYNALHRAELVISGYNVVDVKCEGSDSFLDVDGLTRHGVSNYRVLLEEI